MNPYQCFPYDDILLDDEFREVSQIGYFDTSFKYLGFVFSRTLFILLIILQKIDKRFIQKWFIKRNNDNCKATEQL